MKRLLCILALTFMLACLLASCGDDEISVSEDGYLVVNGEKTEHKVHTKPMISVIDGYVAVNGVKTEYEVNTEPTISVIDGYLVVNGEKTEHKVHTEPTISVIDGYVAVNGVKTEYEVNTADSITVEDGYLVVNGEKTEYKVHTEPTISVIDGYVAVNGVKTEYEVNTADSITVEDGYLVVNGVKTEHEVKNKNHSFGDWKLYNEDETDCEKKLYYRTCPDCSIIEWKEGRYEDHNFTVVTTEPTCQAGGYDTKTCNSCGKVEVCNETPASDHKYKTEYSFDASFHWKDCENCTAKTSPTEHTEGEDGFCTDCGQPLSDTEGVIYGISSNGTYAEVVGYSGTATRVIIADTYEGVPVKVIYKEAFLNNDKITKVIIPDSVTTIGSFAFAYCDSLTSVTIGDSVTEIGSYAFYDCDSLTNVTIGDSVTAIGEYAFRYCTSLESVHVSDIASWCGITFADVFSNPLYYAKNLYLNGELITELVIPEGVTSIGSYAFYDCDSLESVTIPDSVTTIGYEAFCDCDSLTSVTIPDSVTEIGELAFSGCNSSLYTEYEYGTYVGDAENPYAILIGVTNKNLDTYKINEKTKIIADDAFNYCSRLKNITIPNSVTAIGSNAFSSCTSLTNVTIPDSVTRIGSSAFSGCNSIESVTIPDSVTTIDGWMFAYCDSLTSVTIGDSVTEIGSGAFYSCDSLTDVYYKGGEEEWEAIEIGDYNSKLENATIHYNYTEE